MHDDKPRCYLGGAAFAAIVCGGVALLAGGYGVLSAYGEALEQQFSCDDTNCVLDRRTWFERHPATWGLGLCATVLCLGLYAAIVVGRRRAIFR